MFRTGMNLAVHFVRSTLVLFAARQIMFRRLSHYFFFVLVPNAAEISSAVNSPSTEAAASFCTTPNRAVSPATPADLTTSTPRIAPPVMIGRADAMNSDMRRWVRSRVLAIMEFILCPFVLGILPSVAKRRTLLTVRLVSGLGLTG
jgi:hypothetical protein